MRTSSRLTAAALAVALLAPTSVAGAQEAPTISSHVVESFDGEPIIATLFLPPGASSDAPVPLVLRTHGWGGTGETSIGTGTLARLVAEGYAVLTWDQRGFGCSGGTVRIDDPQVEGRDVSALIDWAVANAPIATVDGDPIVGMTGGSYAGGIQTATASLDDRLDALAPEISWADLRYSLYSGEVINQGWVAALYAAGKATATLLGMSPDCPAGPQDGGLDPAIDQGVTEFVTRGNVGPDTLDFFAKSSLASYGVDTPVTVPTLVMQGSVDTLFDLTDGYRIYEHVRDQDAPARFIAFCGGHVACPASYADAGDRAHLDDAIVDWFARYLKGEDVATGAPIEYRTNEGEWRSAPSMPLPGATAVPLAGEAEGLVVVPVLDVPEVAALAGLIAVPEGIPGLPITTSVPTAEGDPRGATFPVAVAEDGPLEILAIPDITLTVSGTTVPLDQVLGPVADALEHAAVVRAGRRAARRPARSVRRDRRRPRRAVAARRPRVTDGAPVREVRPPRVRRGAEPAGGRHRGRPVGRRGHRRRADAGARLHPAGGRPPRRPGGDQLAHARDRSRAGAPRRHPRRLAADRRYGRRAGPRHR